LGKKVKMAKRLWRQKKMVMGFIANKLAAGYGASVLEVAKVIE
jgi:hypothetical protein